MWWLSLEVGYIPRSDIGQQTQFQRFRNFSFENISLCLGKHIGRSLTEFAPYSFKLALNLYIITLNQCCTPPYFKKLGGVFPKYAAAAAYAGVESSELFQICVPCTRFAILYGHVHWSLRILVNKNNSVFDDSDLILAIINLARSEVLKISHVTHTPICTAQK